MRNLYEFLINSAKEFDDFEFSLSPSFLSVGDRLNDYGFIIISPDSISRGLTGRIMDYISTYIEFDVCLMKLKKITDRDLENLYKFAFKRKIIKQEIVYWWLLQESWRIAPCLALVLRSKKRLKDKPIINELLRIKGEYGNVEKNCVRGKFTSISMIMNVMHSSDNVYNMIRESSIFFTEEQLLNEFMGNEKTIPLDDIKHIVKMSSVIDKKPEEIIEDVRIRVEATLKIMNHEEAAKIAGLISKGIKFQDLMRVMVKFKSNEQQIIIMYYVLCGNVEVPVQILEKIFDSNEVYITKWEKIVIKNVIMQHIWDHAKKWKEV